MTSKPASPKKATKPARPASAAGQRVEIATKTAPKRSRAAEVPTQAASSRPPPIFVHSSFRTSSTWLWTRFRAAENTVAYCEIFHEVLAELSVEQISSITPNSWLSRHPQSSPYFIEYFDLLEPRGGARNFSAAFAFERFVPPDGPRGDLSQAELDYVAALIANPADPARVAVLTDNRTLGRCVGLKRALGGLHILAYRNLFQQWNSYSNQHREQNRYFLDTIKFTIENAEHLGFFRKMKDFLRLESDVSSGDWLERCAYDDIFAAFVSLHLYLYMAMYDAIDLLVDVNRLADDKAYRGQVEATILERGGVRIDLSSARDNIEAPLRPLGDPTGARFKIDTLLQHAVRELKPAPEAEAFARRLVDEMWAEHARFTFYTRSLFAAVNGTLPVDDAGKAASDAADAALGAKSAETESALARLRALRSELDTVRDAAQRMVAEADQRHQTAAAAQRDELERLRSESDRNKTQNAELTARLAGVEADLRHEAAFNAKLVASVDALRGAFGAVEREIALRGGAADLEAMQRIDGAANDADAQVLLMIEAIDELGRVMGRDREKITELDARKDRDGARIQQLLARRRTLLDQRDAVLDLVRATRARHHIAITLTGRPADRPIPLRGAD